RAETVPLWTPLRTALIHRHTDNFRTPVRFKLYPRRAVGRRSTSSVREAPTPAPPPLTSKPRDLPGPTRGRPARQRTPPTPRPRQAERRTVHNAIAPPTTAESSTDRRFSR